MLPDCLAVARDLARRVKLTRSDMKHAGQIAALTFIDVMLPSSFILKLSSLSLPLLSNDVIFPNICNVHRCPRLKM